MIPPPSLDLRLRNLLRAIRPACTGAALVALSFSAVVAVGLLANLRATPADPQADPELAALKARLVLEPASTRLKEEIRAADRRLRQELLQRRAVTRKGAVLLVGGAIVLVLSLGLLAAAPPRPEKPAPVLEEESSSRRLAAAGRLGVLGVILLLAGGTAGWAMLAAADRTPALSARAPDEPAPASQPLRPDGNAVARPPLPPPRPLAAVMPGLEQIRRNWPRFRGPLGAGVYDGPAPTRWDANTGEGILWKRELPLPGHSSAVVWGSRVVVTAADKDARKVLCFDADSGRLLWEREVKTADTPAKPPEVNEGTGFAAPTAAADGNCFVAVFATGDIACFEADGNERWSRNLHLGDNAYGYASSLDLVAGLVIVQVDQGGEEEGKSRLLALDVKTGAVAWEVQRPVGGSWASPIVAPLVDKVAVLALGEPYLIAHDLEDGAELWRAKVGGRDGAPSPILAGGLVFAIQTNTDLSAVRPDGNDDVTETHVVWKAEESVPDITSPVSDGNHVWTLTTHGDLTRRRVADGQEDGNRELKMNFQASPSLAGGKLYLLSEEGTMLILEAGGEMKELARCELGEKTVASPAFVGGRIYIRGEKHLFCIGKIAESRISNRGITNVEVRGPRSAAAPKGDLTSIFDIPCSPFVIRLPLSCIADLMESRMSNRGIANVEGRRDPGAVAPRADLTSLFDIPCSLFVIPSGRHTN
jgi:outer membrane protein assembly factor BamB